LLLKEVAALLQREASPADRFFRLGGDEFICLLSRFDDKTAVADAQIILDRIANHAFSIDPRLRISASGGIVFLRSTSDVEEAIKQADMAMYQGKAAGRGKLVTFESVQEDTSIHDEDVFLRHLENITRVATERVAGHIANMARQLSKAARSEADEDPITGLKNNRYFTRHISRAIDSARRPGRSLTIAMMDLDDFRQINKQYRWETGNRALRLFADVARENIRANDWIVRWGGEEFVLVMLDTDEQTGSNIAERVRSHLETQTVQSFDNEPVRVTVSVGVAQLTEQIESVEALVDEASKQLKIAKEFGKNRVIPPPTES
jgi:diguanylate cyclase (GGDEF)-like protein